MDSVIRDKRKNNNKNKDKTWTPAKAQSVHGHH